MMKKTNPGQMLLGLAISCLAGMANIAHAYDVEADSTDNSLYVLLINENPGAVFHSITLGSNQPAFVTAASVLITPPTVLGGGSDLAALEFDIIPGAVIGASGDLVMTVNGLAAGTSLSFDVTVPLTVVANVAATQGLIGNAIPAPDPGGVDTDGDGVSDALEDAFGSDPLFAESTPGNPAFMSTATVPFVPMVGFLVLAAVLSSVGVFRTRQRRSNQISKGQ